MNSVIEELKDKAFGLGSFVGKCDFRHTCVLTIHGGGGQRFEEGGQWV